MRNIRQIVQNAHHLAATVESGVVLLNALRLLPQPMLIVQADLRVDWLNEAAISLAGRALSVGIRAGRLTVSEAGERAKIESLVRALCMPGDGSVALGDPLPVADPAFARPLRLLAVPFDG